MKTFLWYPTTIKILLCNNKVIGLVDPNIVEYYYSLIPKYYYPKRQKYDPHISIVRKEKFDYKRLADSALVYYSPIIHMCQTYFWLNVLSIDLEQIRLDLNLPLNSYNNIVPEGFKHLFHITIGNRK